MPILKTTCPRDCYDACGMIVRTENKKIISIKGEKDHPITKGFLCPRGAKDIQRLKTNRVLSPSKKTGNKFEQISWDYAIKNIADKLKETITNFGAEKILYLDYSGNEGLYNNIFAKRLWYLLGTTFTDGALCTNSGHEALNLHYGLSYGVQPAELPKKKLIVFWGFNAAVNAPHIWKLSLEARHKNNAKIIVIDPIKTLTAKKADLFIQPFPGTDTALAYSIINNLISENKINLEFINNFTTGIQEIKQAAKQWTTEKTAKFCKIDESKIQELTQLYFISKPSATLIGVGLQKRISGYESVRAVSLIPALLGFHRGFFYANSRGLMVDTQLIAGVNSKSKIVSQVNIAEQIKNGYFKVIFINSTNPAVTHTNSLALISGFKRDDVFVVVNETHWSKTAELADIVLSVPSFLEKDDVMLSWGHNYTRYSPKIIEPITNAKTEVEIIQKLAKEMNISDKLIFENPQKVISKAFENAIENDEDLFNKENKLVKLKTKPNNFYPTKSKKIEFYSSLAKQKGINPLPVQRKISVDANKFLLLSTATAKYTNSQFTEIYGKIPSVIQIYKTDAQRLEMKDNDIITIKNNLAKLTFRIKITDSLQKNVLWIPRFVEDLNGIPSNAIFSGISQKLGNGMTIHSTEVEIIL